MNTKNYPKGSEWRKWDFQVQPIKNTFLANCVAHEEQIKNSVSEYLKKAIKNNLSVIAITDHNTGYAIDMALQYVEEKSLDIIILPGVELDSNSGEHIIVIFNKDYKEKLKLTTWKEVIDSFLQTVCDIEPPFFDRSNVAKKINKTTEELIKNINDDIGFVIFAHCLSNDGFFQRCGDARRRQTICEAFLNGELRFIFEIKEYNQKEEVLEKLKNWFGEEKAKLFPIISSSDAHEADDVGKYFTWIKADPTFEGLKQIIYEPEERVFIGDEPDILKRVRENRTKFIKSIKINQKNGYHEEQGIWFKDIEINLNSGLIAIIGNKGNGKSALTDIISLCGNSHLYSDFSFLKEDRFLKNGLAENFEAELIWESGEVIKKSLNEETDRNSPERVRYLPQNYFEKLTNNLETYDFEKTLEKVVFSYIPEDQRLGQSSFSELIEYKKQVSDKEINKLRDKINDLNKKIIELESKSHPDYKKQIEEKLKLKRKELEEHEKTKPKEVPDPSKDVNISEDLKKKQEELLKLNDKLNELKKQKDDKQIELNETTKALQELIIIQNEINDFRVQLEEYCNQNSDKFKKYGLDITQILIFKIDDTPIKQKRQEIENKIRNLKSILLTIDEINKLPENERQNAEQNSLVVQLREKEKEIKTIASQLSEPQKNYQKYLEDLKKWEDKKSEIEGNENTPDTIKWYEKEIKYLENQAITDLQSYREERLKLSIQIFNKKKDILSIYDSFKNSVDENIKKFKDILDDYEINIDSSIKIRSDFYNEFLWFINQRVRGSFHGEYEGRATLEKLIRDKDINTEDGIRSLLSDFIVYLEKDKRDNFNNETRHIKDQILKVERWSDFYDYIFSLDYLEPIYELKLGNKNLSQLSPGEKGALLIVFYLLLDKENIPLIIDQPEENLDNESVYKILSHFIREVKKKRQVIIVTHNPNLAIVGDAEQIIFVKIDKKSNNAFSFESGSIENPYINKHASDILEGTLKAFDIRRLKYLKVD